MRVTVCNTYDRLWGASIASMRTTEALRSVGLDAVMLNLQAVAPSEYIDVIENSALQHRYSQFLLLLEKTELWFIDTRKGFNFEFSLSTTGRNVMNRPCIQNADVIHLNWTNNAFLSFKGLEKLFQTAATKQTKPKKIVWSLHDMWAFTGGCHYSGTCKNYTAQCGNCKFLKNASPNDASHRQWLKKQKLYHNYPITFTAPSNWMAQEAMQSGLFSRLADKSMPPIHVETVSNPINTDIFAPQDQQQARRYFNLPPDKPLVLFGSAKFADHRKGFQYLYPALVQLKKEKGFEDVELVVYGFAPEAKQFPEFTTHYVGMLKTDSDLARCYNACDVVALPSVADNQPLVIMEALACGTPALAFAIGGIPEMIFHEQNGYLSPLGDIAALVAGLKFIITNKLHLSPFARRQAVLQYSYPQIGEKWRNIYSS